MVEKQEGNSAPGFTCRRPGEAGAFILEKTKKTDADSRQQSSAAIESLFVRHRLCAFPQRSQRYVNEKSFAFVEPESIREKTETHRLFEEFMAEVKNAYSKLQELGIKNEDARFVLPNAVQSEIVISANFRELRHIFCVRCDRHAQWEIRNAALQMLRIIKKEAPSVFGDFVIDEK